jgi:hypothetical protein
MFRMSIKLLHVSTVCISFAYAFKNLQEPSEEPFDISLVSREVRSLPLQEKNAPGKKAPAAAASTPVSAVDAYQKLLSSIPEFSGFGRLFKVCIVFQFLSSVFFLTSTYANFLNFCSPLNPWS